MLGKLLKHEFRATGRVMLPVYAAVVVLSVLANISIRLINVVNSTLLTILFGLIIFAFVLGIIAAGVMTLVLMIKRFYQNLLKDEGYLMHTLPVTVHEQVWSKMIVSCVWFVATFLVIWIVMLLTGLIQSGTSLAQFFEGFPSWAEIREAMERIGLRTGDLWTIGLEMLVMIIISGLATCLHFYAAMSLGHMFAKDKILLSIVFFIGISFVFSLLGTGYGIARLDSISGMMETLSGVSESVRFAQRILLQSLLVEAVQAAALYVATTLSLKKGLNLA